MKNDFIYNWHSQLKKGLLPLYVLLVLRDKERYGYELIQDIKNNFDIDVAEGTLYPLLIRLTNDELLTHKWVEQPSGIPRKYYFITEIGFKNLQTMLEHSQLTLSKIKSL
jgi:PadR family transcriptional regulator PadR